jgi:hypothetical protein
VRSHICQRCAFEFTKNNFRLSIRDESIPARSFSTVHGRSRTTKPRPARQSIRFPSGANVAQTFGHDAGMGEIATPIPRVNFQGDGERFSSMRLTKHTGFSV